MLTACANRYSDGVEPLVADLPSGRFVCLLDGSGSWGTGAEAAAWFREWIDRHIRDTELSSPAFTAMLVAGIAQLPPEIAEVEYFDWSFSIAVAICQGDHCHIGCRGKIAAAAVHGKSIERLFVPVRLVDFLVSQGKISPEAAEKHEYRRVICSQRFDADAGAELQWQKCVLLGRDDRIVLGNAVLPRFLETRGFMFKTAIELRDAIERYGGSSSPTAIFDCGATVG